VARSAAPIVFQTMPANRTGTQRPKSPSRLNGASPVMVIDFPWDAEHLFFTVREPFPTRTTGASLVFGQVTSQAPLFIESQMAENGVIFSDGIEKDFLEFSSGTQAIIGLAERKGVLVT